MDYYNLFILYSIYLHFLDLYLYHNTELPL
jgi:hypothetical protein